LLETTKWETYGAASGNPKCANCMVSCGYEPSAVMDGFGSLKGMVGMALGTFRTYADKREQELMDNPAPGTHGHEAPVLEETKA
jgi:hypothetical protein